jgi:uncharacterized protein YqgC (DUF456 family)
MNIIVALTAVLAMLACLAVIPLGLPGLWLILVITLGLVLGGQLTWTFGLVVAGSVLIVEVAEILVLKRFGKAFGGSSRAFWGAVVGGMVGLFVGVPIPLIGPLITAFLGTFLGAGAVTWLETMSLERSARVGWGVLLARTAAVALKVTAAVVVIGAVSVALLV